MNPPLLLIPSFVPLRSQISNALSCCCYLRGMRQAVEVPVTVEAGDTAAVTTAAVAMAAEVVT